MSQTRRITVITKNAPDTFGLSGSFVITAICQDGIVMTTESRANIFDKKEKSRTPIAYYDTCQKAFKIGKYALAETGQGLILSVFFSAIVDDFKRALTQDPPIQELLPAFIQVCKDRYPEPAFLEMRRQKLFAAGYEDGRPTICYFNEAQQPGPFGCVRDHGLIQSAPTSFARHADSLSYMTCSEVAELAGQAIEEYASNGDRWKTIGGPLDVMQITEAGASWLKKNTPVQEWKYVQDFVESYHQGDVDITLISPATEAVLYDLLATVSKDSGERT